MSRVHGSFLSLSGVVLVCLGASPAMAVQPSLGAISPYGVQRGVETQVQFSGARLGDAEQLLLYSPGIEVKGIEKVNDNAVKATLVVATDCRLGNHAVRVRTKTGVSNLRTFSVGALPELTEVEPNSEFTTPQAVQMNSTVSGIVQNEDADFFVVEAKKGQRIVAELEGIRLGNNTFFDPYLAILNSERFELSRSDDAALLRQDCLCSIVAPEDGKYIIQIRESAYGGNGNCKYRLHIGDFPRPTAVLPAGGRPGETIEVRWIGDPAGEWTEKITLPSDPDLKYPLFASDDHGIAPSPNRVRVVDLQNTIEAEPNNTREQATSATGPGALNGVIEEPGDVDYYKFTAKKGQQFDVRAYARKTVRSPLDSVLYIQNSGGGNVASNDDSGGPDSYFRFNCPADGDYFVLIRDHLNAGGPDYAYRVEIAPIERTLTMTLPEKQRYVSTTLTVHRANRTAMMVNAGRANWGGELKIDVEGLPDGISFEAPIMPSNRSTIPVVFTAADTAADTAAETAPTGGALADLVGKSVDDKLGIVGHLSQRTMLVRGQNNRDVWGHDADKMAVALAEEVPYKIDIVQPKVPIVRNGSMGLKIVATRKEGFDAAIAVRMLYNPPGIGSSGSISIPKGQNEAVIPLTANSGAAIGKWPIVVTGRSSFGGGAVETATQMSQLDISDSFFSFAFEKTAAELGQEAALVVKVEKKVDFPETGKVQLLGLPANTQTKPEPIDITKGTTELVFPISISAEAKPNTYKSLVCRTTILRDGEPITHTFGTGELRIDKPIPPKANAPKPAAQPKPQPTVAKAPAKKPLSRLEQLRLKRKQEKGAE